MDISVLNRQPQMAHCKIMLLETKYSFAKTALKRSSKVSCNSLHVQFYLKLTRGREYKAIFLVITSNPAAANFFDFFFHKFHENDNFFFFLFFFFSILTVSWAKNKMAAIFSWFYGENKVSGNIVLWYIILLHILYRF